MLNKQNQKFLKHSPSWWLTFEKAAERLLDQCDVINYYFLNYIPKNKNSTSKMQTSLYKKPVDCLNDTFLISELYFAKLSSDIFTTFTLLFQKDNNFYIYYIQKLKICFKKLWAEYVNQKLLLNY